jgi:hypothetical protein
MRTWGWLLLPLLGACAHGNHLRDYDYSGRTVTSVSSVPRRPDVLTGPYFVAADDPLRALLRAGSRVAVELQARQLRERLDTAVTRIDVAAQLEQSMLDRASRYLGAQPMPGEPDSDFLFDVVVVEYGIDAEEWDAAATFYIEAEASLLHRPTGDEIWRAEVHGRDPIGPGVFGPARGVRNVITAAQLADLSVDELVEALASLAEYAAGAITDRLRDDLRKARDR